MSENQRQSENKRVNVQSQDKFEDSCSEFNRLIVSDDELAEDPLKLGGGQL
jgi:hypothetical protein